MYKKSQNLIILNKIDLVVDATHPFAAEATINAIKSTTNSGINYIRFERPSLKITEDNVIQASSFEEAAVLSKKLIGREYNGKIMHLAGVSTLPHLKDIDPKLIVVRVLPVLNSIRKCNEMGIPTNNIVAMQGTFTREFNKALMREYNIKIVVTKESGESGGTPSKIDAANELGIPIIIVNRPVIPQLDDKLVCSDLNKLLSSINDIKTRMPRFDDNR